MMKKLILTLLLVVFPFSAKAGECKDGQLSLEFLDVKKFAPTEYYTAQLMGIIEVPNTNYDYSLTFTQGEEDLRATLYIHIKEPELLSAQVITPVTINNTIQIPHISKTFTIEVMKHFKWGPEYFKVDLPKKPAFSPKLYCMSPEQNEE